MRINIIGGGYVGLVTAVCFSELGYEVHLVEIDREKAGAINRGIAPIYEPGLDNLLKKHIHRNLTVSGEYQEIVESEFTFMCVGTPPAPDGSADLRFIRSASRSLGSTLKDAKDPHTVVVKSTVPPGTTGTIVAPAVLEASGRQDGSITFAMNPEFLREGQAVGDFFHPDRIVIGCGDDGACRRVAALYDGIDAPLVMTGLEAAEMIKYVSNAFLATKISFSNEIGNICKKLGIDVYEVMRGVGLDSRISPHFLNAGAGFGGSCFPKDVAALVSLAESIGEEPLILKSVMAVNEQQALRMVTLLESRIGDLRGKQIAVLGLAFKDNTDDIRDSRAIPVIQALVERGALVRAFDPLANTAMAKVFPGIMYYESAEGALSGADACLVMTEWPEFSHLDNEFDRMASRVIIEGRRILSCDGKEGICW
ncbi:MAG TPA: UDP-glucose/GDP-mannose dehydrogenase family protein [Methanolinea sp.]|nr:UDP-glucose/GDP-mannose dehydrogenase family protein [Methanolinea sp.]HQK56299.1 UDP-glucose/GDP-mannose dehydrogenase family protein [Methanolinea sp.]